MSEQELTDRDNDMLALLEWVRLSGFQLGYGKTWWLEIDSLDSDELLKRFKNRDK